jgi:hypothetical protein
MKTIRAVAKKFRVQFGRSTVNFSPWQVIAGATRRGYLSGYFTNTSQSEYSLPHDAHEAA